MEKRRKPMRTLLSFDEKNYTDDMPVFEKYAVRGVIIRDGKIAMQKAKTGYYKVLGGGVDKGESLEDALVREVAEESGLLVIRDSIRLVGEILEQREDLYTKGHKYVCHSIFFFCDAQEEMVETNLTQSEVREGFSLAWATPEEIVESNSKVEDKPWVTRDTGFIKMLLNGEV